MDMDFSKWRSSKDEVNTYYQQPFNAVEVRALMVARIERTIKQLNGERVSPKGGKDFETLHNEGVVYRPSLYGSPLEFLDTDDEDGFHSSVSNLEQMLPELIEYVKKGGIDEYLERAWKARDDAPKAEQTSAKPASRKAASEPKPDRNYSPESRLRFRINGMRRGKVMKPDDEIKAKLLADGIDEAMIDAALKPDPKAKRKPKAA